MVDYFSRQVQEGRAFSSDISDTVLRELEAGLKAAGGFVAKNLALQIAEGEPLKVYEFETGAVGIGKVCTYEAPSGGDSAMDPIDCIPPSEYVVRVAVVGLSPGSELWKNVIRLFAKNGLQREPQTRAEDQKWQSLVKDYEDLLSGEGTFL